MRRALSIALLTVGLVLLAACGSAGTTAPSAGETPAPSGATATPAIAVLPTDTPRPLPTPPPIPTATPEPTEAPPAETPVAAETPVVVEETPTEAPTEAPPAPATGEMVQVPAGEFLMGSDDFDEDEKPARTVTLDAFEIDKYEVTNEQFAAFVEATGYQTGAEAAGQSNDWRYYFTDGKERHPVVAVTWNDAQAYCEWAGKRLPTEMEWEKAARGTDGRIYPWGNEWDSTKLNSKEAGYRGTTAVGSFPDGASPSGAMDMAGNIWEWTADWYKAYEGSTYTSDYFGERFRVTRGGDWFSKEDKVRTSNRNSTSAEAANDNIGFRCAR